MKLLLVTFLFAFTACSSKEAVKNDHSQNVKSWPCLLYTSPSPRDAHESRMPSSA